VRAFASVPLGLFFYLFAQFAIYRARRYRLTRTIWRGVRFWMTGSGVSYAWRAGLWGCSRRDARPRAAVGAGGARALQDAPHRLWRLQGRFEATGWEFFKRGWWLWLLAWPILLV
jgi:hypothetical protein